jgi:hypothetical protein
LSRWKTKSSSAENGANDGVALVVSGSIRSPDETDALGVELTINGSEIALHADGSELGRWESEVVEIRQIDATSFEFNAEGDRLIFLPDDPAAFGIIPIARGVDAESGRRKGRKAKRSKDHADEPGAPPSSDTSAAGDNPKVKKLSKPAKVKKLSKPAKVKKLSKPAKVKKLSKPAKVKRPSKPAKEPRAERTGAWLRTLDMARRYDLLGLDRVPVDVELRGGEHQHTWDHRVAATSGAGKHICTLCGRIRR